MRSRPLITTVSVFAALLGTYWSTAAASGGGPRSPVAVHGSARPSALRLPEDFIGVLSDDAFTNGAAYRDQALARERSSGVELIRREFDWSTIETAPGHYDFRASDQEVAAAATHGLRLLPILFDPPVFDSARPSQNPQPGTYPPRRFADLARFAAAVVARYGPTGSFWSENPQVPKFPIHHWQIWNEPNLPAYWASGPDPRQYAAMLRTVAPAIRAVEPHADIITAGITNSRIGTPYREYIQGMLRHGAAAGFDTLGINPYAASPALLVDTIAVARGLLNQSGDSHARIWVTELGWADGGIGHTRLRVSTTQQGRLVGAGLRAIAKVRRKLNVRGLVYFDWRDSAPYPPTYRDLWGLHTGLLTRAGEPKPAYFAFRSTATALEHG